MSYWNSILIVCHLNLITIYWNIIQLKLLIKLIIKLLTDLNMVNIGNKALINSIVLNKYVVNRVSRGIGDLSGYIRTKMV